MSALWQSFENTDNSIRRSTALTEDHIYITSEIYEKIGQTHSEALEELEAIIHSLRTSNETRPGLIGKICYRMAALKRFIVGVSEVKANEHEEFYRIRIDTIKRLWNQLEDLYDQSWDQTSNPLAAGLNQDDYDQLNDMVLEAVTKLQAMLKQHMDFGSSQLKPTCQLLFRSQRYRFPSSMALQ